MPGLKSDRDGNKRDSQLTSTSREGVYVLMNVLLLGLKTAIIFGHLTNNKSLYEWLTKI